jgi:general stress protein 26
MKDETRQANIKQMQKLLEEFSVAMMTTIQPRDGSLHSRPMMAQAPGFDGSLWFFSRFASGKVDEIRAGSQVNLAFSDPNQERYVSISGVAHLERDREKMQELWSELYRAWFPRGLEEPDLVLLRIEVSEAEVWDAATRVNGELLKFA